MEKKYKYTWCDDSMDGRSKPLAIMLDDMGREGWELCSAFAFSSFSRYFFKKVILENE